jgi:hypothetical protein
MFVCPKCETTISMSTVRQHFVCPKCSTNLAGHVWGPVVVAIVLWSIIEAIIAEALYSQFGQGLTIMALKIVLSIVIGLPLFYFLVKRYGTVEVDEKPTPHS